MKRGERRGVSVISCSAEHECLLLRSSGRRRREAASDTSLLLPVLLAQLTSHTGLHRWTRARPLPHKRSLFPLNPLAHPDAAAPMILAAPRTLATPRLFRHPDDGEASRSRRTTFSRLSYDFYQRPRSTNVSLRASVNSFKLWSNFKAPPRRGEPGAAAPLHRFRFGNGTLDKWTVSRR